jgi:predicted ATPase
VEGLPSLAIKTLRISNYKAFADIDVTLGNFNVLVGANASGKTSLIQIFRFVRDVALYDLDNAISLQGGVKYLRNMKLGKSRQFRVELVTDQASRFRVRRDTHKDGHDGGLDYSLAESLVIRAFH